MENENQTDKKNQGPNLGCIVTDGFKTNFKRYALEKGISMTEIMIRALEEFMENHPVEGKSS